MFVCAGEDLKAPVDNSEICTFLLKLHYYLINFCSKLFGFTENFPYMESMKSLYGCIIIFNGISMDLHGYPQACSNCVSVFLIGSA